MKRSICVACAYIALAGPSCFGQLFQGGVSSFVSPGSEPGVFTISYTVSAPAITRTILAGHPYSGEEISRQTKMLSDGTPTVQQGPSAIKYRDAAGRIRTERRALRPMGIVSWVDAPVVPEIVDPVAGFIYYLDPVNRIAHRMLLPQESFRIVTDPPNVNYPASSTKETDSVRTYEPLGTAVISGIEVVGRRITTTYAVDILGKDSPLVSTAEIWTSPELGLTVLSKSKDPRTGEFTNSVINISREEPDRSLFQVPPEYEIVDEPKVPFTFTISITGSAMQHQFQAE